ncbi:unnamed protein product [Echinostoma caproni]|uniref:Uncharacterized protein n=1 Tax=Echinostoma caproni TaxID=27848 RepID=A0A183AUL1_9TREM|nr:unnamed protein product [Echinostoma caproni]
MSLRNPHYGRGVVSRVAADHSSLAPRGMLPYDQASQTVSVEEFLLTAFSLQTCLPTKEASTIQKCDDDDDDDDDDEEEEEEEEDDDKDDVVDAYYYSIQLSGSAVPN